MQPHLTVEQRQLALWLKARGWPLRGIGPDSPCCEQNGGSEPGPALHPAAQHLIGRDPDRHHKYRGGGTHQHYPVADSQRRLRRRLASEAEVGVHVYWGRAWIAPLDARSGPT